MAKGGKTIAEEYIISIIPELDKEKFNEARKQVGELTKKGKGKSEYQQKRDEIKLQGIAEREQLKNKKEILKVDREQLKNDRMTSQWAKSDMIAAIGTAVAVAVAAFKAIYDVMEKITESAEDFSNSMITANSAFVNKNTRQLMATFGVSGQTATGMSSVMNLMGITTSDFSMMTPGQMQLYSRLMQQWQDGMNSINSADMEKFQESMQLWQSELASAKLDLQIQFYKMLIDIEPAISNFFSSIVELIRSLGELLNSPLVKTLISTLSGIISGIVKIISAVAYVLSGDFSAAKDVLSGSSTTSYTTNNYSVTSTSNNSFSGDNSSMYAIATQTQQTEINSTMIALEGTGGT